MNPDPVITRSGMNLHRALAIARKEVFHILRDPFTLGLAVLLPLILVTVFGLAIEFNITNIPVAVYDGDRSSSSRQLVDSMGSSRFFLPYEVPSPASAVQELDANRAKAALIIEHPFERDLRPGRQARAQMLVDGSDSSSVVSLVGYLGGLQDIVNRKIAGASPRETVRVKTRFLYNPELKSRWFTVPGLIVVILSVLSILLTALTVAREWENGSMELLLSTPAGPLDIIIGKLAPYVVLVLGAVALVYVLARVFLGVPFRGSHLIFLAGCLLFLATCLALGLLISVLTRDQRLAMQLALMSGLLPSMLLSGFIFPLESMPEFFQGLTMLLPARWFMTICRDTFLKGAGFTPLGTSFLALGLMAGLLVLVSAGKFKKDLEP